MDVHPASAPQTATREKMDLKEVIEVSSRAAEGWGARVKNPRLRGLQKIRGGRGIERGTDRRRERGDGPLSLDRRLA